MVRSLGGSLAVLVMVVVVVGLAGIGPRGAAGHAWMVKPASREHVAWTRGEEPEPQSAGGPSAYGPCGVVKGRDYMRKRFETGVAGMEGNRLRAGGVVEIEVAVTAHHLGHFEFHLCTDASRSDVWECLKEHKLVRSRGREGEDPAPIHAEYPERWYLPPSEVAGWPLGRSSPPGVAGRVYRMWYELPRGVSCVGGQCLLQFFYYSGNSCTGKGYNTYYTVNEGGNMVPPNRAPGTDGAWAMSGTWWTGSAEGTCYDGSSGQITSAIDNRVSLGTPERFWNCADVSIEGGVAPPPPTPTSSTPAPAPAPVPVPTTSSSPSPTAPTTTNPTPPPTSNVPTPTGGRCTATGCTGSGLEGCGRCSRDFVHCVSAGVGFKKACPSGLVFDSRLGQCNWPHAVGCASAAAEKEEDDGSSVPVVPVAAGGGALLLAAVVGAVVVVVFKKQREQPQAATEEELLEHDGVTV